MRYFPGGLLPELFQDLGMRKMFVPLLLATLIAAIFAYMNSSGANSAKHTEKTGVRQDSRDRPER